MRFADESTVVLDVDPAFPFSQSTRPAQTVEYRYAPGSKEPTTRTVASDPRNELVTYALRRMRGVEPPIKGVSVRESLARNEALLNLKSSAEIHYGVNLA